MRKKACIIFTKVPIPGYTKTRLMPYLTRKQCARLHQCFLTDICRQCKKINADCRIYYTPKSGQEVMVSLLGEGLAYYQQKGDSLGEKMKNAMEETLAAGYDACILIGSDIPELRAEDFRQAYRLLRTKDVVFGPSRDGGYYLLGMKNLYQEVFLEECYAGGRVLENIKKKLLEKGISYGDIRMCRDIDEKRDIAAYRKRMRRSRFLRNSKTGRYLTQISKISIIVPVYNEETTIMSIQEQLLPWKDECEVIFVDGGSTDGTTKKIKEASFRLLHSRKGRGIQMNEGAKNSEGDILFFLHSDSELPDGFVREIKEVMSHYKAGCFGIAFHSENFFMWTCRLISNHRAKGRKIMFGDQGIFIDRTLFFQMGMFPEIPIMEDYQFSLLLKKRKIKIGMTKKRIYTSDRRFPEGTIPKLKVMWRMNRLRKRYRSGEDIMAIAADYKDIRR
ncbi:MAG: TIGR04283 family arsenosugar biosynthesis glycosyltransferase [Eubacteriales bacterium]|nr:TIGR04283 family arsenosugar biosynthesis glycosyltransferase [Eubacteriales bacterium]